MTGHAATVPDLAFSTDKSSRTIVMIHGMWSTPSVWDRFRSFYEERGYKVLTPRLRCHEGEQDKVSNSKLGETSVLDYADDLEAELRSLEQAPFIIGHSMGGFLSQVMASRGLAKAVVPLASAHCAPLMALSLETTWIFREALFTTRFWRNVQKPDYKSMRWGILNGLPEDDAEALYAELIPESGRTLFEFALWFLDRRRAAFIEQGSINCPMLFLTGDQDRLTPPSLCKRNADFHGRMAQFEMLPGHAHWLPSEPGWERIAERILAFFEMQQNRTLRAAA